ncbi:transketolase family protein [Patescibacteria group bacterium]
MLNKSLNLSKNIFNANIKTASTRDGFGDALIPLGKDNKDIVVLSADLMESTRVHKFAKAYPKRFVQVGVAEQNMVGVGAGLAMNGKIPFITSFAVFSPGRNWEQIRASVCYSNTNVKIASTHAGLSADKDGATHQGLEDIALTRVLPNITILSPADYNQTQKAVKAAAHIKGPVYIRLAKNESPIFTTSKTPFNVIAAQILKKGEDVTIIAHGPIVYEALKAARELELKFRIDAEVINCHTIKPLDEETIVKSAIKTGKVVIVEEHQVAGGLGSAVAELLSEKAPTQILRMGIKDVFTESGDYNKLLTKYKLNSANIVKKVKSLILSARGKK